MKARLLCLPLLPLALTAGCSARIQPQTQLDPCARVRLDPAPLWTASAAWMPAEDRLLLIGPDRRSLLGREDHLSLRNGDAETLQ